MAVEFKDVPMLYPFISDTGNFSPESCVFGQFLNMGSILSRYFHMLYLK